MKWLLPFGNCASKNGKIHLITPFTKTKKEPNLYLLASGLSKGSFWTAHSFDNLLMSVRL